MDSSDLSDGPITLQEYLEVKKALASSEAKVQQLMKVNNNLSEELRRLQKEVGSTESGWKDRRGSIGQKKGLRVKLSKTSTNVRNAAGETIGKSFIKNLSLRKREMTGWYELFLRKLGLEKIPRLQGCTENTQDRSAKGDWTSDSNRTRAGWRRNKLIF